MPQLPQTLSESCDSLNIVAGNDWTLEETDVMIVLSFDPVDPHPTRLNDLCCSSVNSNTDELNLTLIIITLYYYPTTFLYTTKIIKKTIVHIRCLQECTNKILYVYY